MPLCTFRTGCEERIRRMKTSVSGEIWLLRHHSLNISSVNTRGYSPFPFYFSTIRLYFLSIPNGKVISKVFSHKNSFFSGNFSLYAARSLRKWGKNDENMEGKCYVRKLACFTPLALVTMKLFVRKANFYLRIVIALFRLWGLVFGVAGHRDSPFFLYGILR